MGGVGCCATRGDSMSRREVPHGVPAVLFVFFFFSGRERERRA
jgi:hypothetical protein